LLRGIAPEQQVYHENSRPETFKSACDEPDYNCVSDAEAVARAADAVGIRLAFVVPLRDCRTLGYAADEQMLALHSPEDREIIREKWLYRFPPPPEYMMLVREIARRIEGPTVSVQLGPNSPQACTDALFEATAAMRITIVGSTRTCWRPQPNGTGAMSTTEEASFVIWMIWGCFPHGSPARTASGSAPTIAAS
jgi:hypothetical protein